MSLRWRLSLSYAAIALLATISLGIVLFLSLQSYYRQQESIYLDGNAQALSQVMESLLATEAAGDENGALDFVQAALDTYAFLLQAQITILSSDNSILVQSQAPETLQANTALSLSVTLDGIEQQFGQTVEPGSDGASITSFYSLQGSNSAISTSQTLRGNSTSSFASPLALMETPGLAPGLLNPANSRRSDYVAQTVLRNLDGQQIGVLQLEDGPAFGQEVLTNVSIAFALAGFIAILLSAWAGTLLSQQIGQPIQKLAQATDQMADGNLSARIDLQRSDEIGQLASGFNEMADRVERLVATLRQFVADAAHEINTPLTALKTNIELARRGQEPERVLGEAEAQLDRLTQLSDNLLNLSQLEAGVSKQSKERIDLRELIAGRSEYHATRADQAEIEMILNLTTKPVEMVGHEGQLLQVCDNLIDNAVKFTPAGGQISLTLSQNNQSAQIIIKDNGIGLNGASREQLLERFTRGNNVSQTEGSGLGLAIVRAAVRQHQGTIELIEEKDGTRVVVELPIGDVESNSALVTPLM